MPVGVVISLAQQAQTFPGDPLIGGSAATVPMGSAERGEGHEKQNDEIRPFCRGSSTHAFQNIIFSTLTKTYALAHHLLFRKRKSSAETDGFELGTRELKLRRLGEPLLGLVRGRFPCDGGICGGL
jgi:hypothetical protein